MLKKGLFDLGLSLIAVVTFIYYNGTDVFIFGHKWHMPVVLYAVLAIALIWGSINVTNCSDGVDGLSGGVSIIELLAFYVIFNHTLSSSDYARFSALNIIFVSVLIAYLYYNWFPSKILMGDAGSRSIGFFIALTAMKSLHPFAFILLSLVFLVDGGLGLVKLALMRTVCKGKTVFGNIRFPLHDELRKNRGWSVPKIAVFFISCELVICIITGIILMMVH